MGIDISLGFEEGQGRFAQISGEDLLNPGAGLEASPGGVDVHPGSMIANFDPRREPFREIIRQRCRTGGQFPDLLRIREEKRTDLFFFLETESGHLGTDYGIFGCMGLLACEDVCPKDLPLQEQLGFLRRKMGIFAIKKFFKRA